MHPVKSFRVWITSSIVLCIALAAITAKTPVTTPAPPRNFGVIWPNRLTRSGLPDDSGLAWLHNQGVKSIVTFRPQNDVDYQKFSFKVLRLPLRDGPPTGEQVRQFLAFIQEPQNQPVHIHCTAGQSRTGLMAALARYAIDGWPLGRAFDEARQYRQGRDLSNKRSDWLKAWAGGHPAGSFRIEQ